MNAVGIDVSKGKSTVAVLRPFGEVAASPFDVIHNDNDLKQLAELIKALPGESKVVMEYTGTYFEPIAQFLHNNGIFVSVVNALLVHDYGGNSLRKVKTDKKDALKLASYALDRWTELDEYIPADEQRKTLKLLNRQYNQSIKIQTMMKNNLISLTDSVFPGINKPFTSPERQSDGHEKWVDFLKAFPHKDCVAKLCLSVLSRLMDVFFPSEKNDTPVLVPRPVFLEMVMPSLAGLLSAILKTPSDIGYLLIFHCTQCTYDIIHRFTLNFKQIHR